MIVVRLGMTCIGMIMQVSRLCYWRMIAEAARVNSNSIAGVSHDSLRITAATVSSSSCKFALATVVSVLEAIDTF